MESSLYVNAKELASYFHGAPLMSRVGWSLEERSEAPTAEALETNVRQTKQSLTTCQKTYMLQQDSR